MSTISPRSKTRRIGRLCNVMALVCLMPLGACVSLDAGGDGAEPQATPLEDNAIAMMSAETRYERARGCASTARLVLNADTSDKLIEFGFDPVLANAASVDFAAQSERAAVMGEAAARDAIAAGAVLGVADAEVRSTLEADYQRLEGAFRGVAEPEPELALFTIQDRLSGCVESYPSL